MLGKIIAGIVAAAIGVNMTYMGVSETTVVEIVENVEATEVTETEETVEVVSASDDGLQFLDVDGNVLMDGTAEYIKEAKCTYGLADAYPNYNCYITIYFTPEGREKFKAATEAVLEKQADGDNFIAIAVDSVVYSTPMVAEVIDSDTCVITNGSFTKEAAEELADAINDGIK